jgi:hypothetical protein
MLPLSLNSLEAAAPHHGVSFGTCRPLQSGLKLLP